MLSADGDWLKVGKLHLLPEKRTTHNLEVEGDHNFFVGATKAWTHNIECSIIGNPQITSLTHAATSARLAQEMATSGEYVLVTLNLGVGNGLIRAGFPQLGKLVGNRLRPDVVGITSSGQIDVFEVLSKTDTFKGLFDRVYSTPFPRDVLRKAGFVFTNRSLP